MQSKWLFFLLFISVYIRNFLRRRRILVSSRGAALISMNPFMTPGKALWRRFLHICNYGQDGEGIYTRLSYGDCDFFMMDDRWWRNADDMAQTVDGKPNPGKRMWGIKQMEWLKSALVISKANFKFIVTGDRHHSEVIKYNREGRYPLYDITSSLTPA